jgi:hypothetical protein
VAVKNIDLPSVLMDCSQINAINVAVKIIQRVNVHKASLTFWEVVLDPVE